MRAATSAEQRCREQNARVSWTVAALKSMDDEPEGACTPL